MFSLFVLRFPICIDFNSPVLLNTAIHLAEKIQDFENVTIIFKFLSVCSPRRKSSVREVPPQDDNDEEMDGMLKEFQQQRAAKALQRQWRGYQGRKMEIEKQDRQAVETQNQAATTLQKNWRKHRDKVREAH